MTIIRRPTPLGELISLRNTMDRLFDDTLGRPRSGWPTATPSVAVDSHSTADSAVVVEAALPPADEPTAELAAESVTEQDS